MQTASGTPRVFPAFLLVALAFLINMMGTTLPTEVYRYYQAAYGFTPATITVIFAVYAIGVLGALLLVGNWSDQLGRKRMLTCGLIASAASALVFIVSTGLPGLMMARLLSGVSAGIFTGTATVAVIEAAPARLRHRATLAATASNMLGLGCGPVLSGLIVEYLPAPMRTPYAVHIVLIAIALLALRSVPETAHLPAQAKLRMQRIALPRPVRGAFVPAALSGFAGFVVVGFFTAVSPQLMRTVLGFHSDVTIGLVVFLLFASSAAGQAAQSLLAPSWRLPAGCIGLIAGLLLVALSTIDAASGALLAGTVFAGLGQGASFRSGLGELTARSPADARAGVTSAYFVVLYVALSLPIIGLGIATQRTDIRHATLLFAAGTIVLVIVAMGFLLLGNRDTRLDANAAGE
ncbi:MFS transporter [Paraburkholderia rhizosphaerae]|uniref:Putative MFS family arabinose efflux permease n=1 Tax=Paraburkholderia rhizosphaerae TaxID=480658 RepID=A0A4R8LGN9_9BURK|nr:MFS transporter [Paraburkholderia rhizosphaerae]TDY42287.1 putative MFS family arabinose efflux permease [Paraburkholderia rhizosphaerae]